jgi:hypothetical protein
MTRICNPCSPRQPNTVAVPNASTSSSLKTPPPFHWLRNFKAGRASGLANSLTFFTQRAGERTTQTNYPSQSAAVLLTSPAFAYGHGVSEALLCSPWHRVGALRSVSSHRRTCKVYLQACPRDVPLLLACLLLLLLLLLMYAGRFGGGQRYPTTLRGQPALTVCTSGHTF